MYICNTKYSLWIYNLFFKLLGDNEKYLLKSILVSSPCFYTLISLFFPDFLHLNIISEIIIALGITIIMTGLFYFQVAFIEKYNKNTIFGLITSLLVFTNFFAILMGSISGFRVSTIYSILIAIGISYTFSIVRSFIRRKKAKKE